MPPDDDFDPGGAAEDAVEAFPDSAPGAVAGCPVPKPGKGKAGPSWKPASISKALANCDGGTGVVAAAKAANGGKDPTIKVGNSALGSGGSVDYTTGEITLDPGYDKCNTIETLIQEMSNLSHKADFEKAEADCAAGKLSREEYIKTVEKIEYDGVARAIKAENACMKKWGCTKNSFSYSGITGKATTDFDEYYKNWLGNDHKEYWGKSWDSNCKATYDAAHPATPPAPPAPPPASVTPPPAATDSKGCFIATAAYGSPLAPQVQVLREIRDNVLRRTGWGSRFFERYWSYYYQISPAISAQMNADPDLQQVMRWSVVAPMVNYLKWLRDRPRQWNLEGVDPEMREFLERMKADMDAWLAEIELPDSFPGLENDAIVAELNIALDLVLRGRPDADTYLTGLLERGVLPLRFRRCAESRLLRSLLGAGRQMHEINLILYGRTGEEPARLRVKELEL